nr:hypothetical protein [Nanoarchaeota archaeon]
MRYKDSDYSRVLVGDFYHWELGTDGYFTVKENTSKVKPYKMSEMELKTEKLGDIIEDIKDE